MDSIDTARAYLEHAEEAYQAALDAPGTSNATLERLAQAVADAEQRYYRACDMWEPRDCSGVIGAGGLVYSDADPGL